MGRAKRNPLRPCSAASRMGFASALPILRPLQLQTHLRSLATQLARVLLDHSTLMSKRAQGRPGADLAPTVCGAKCVAQKTAQQHTGGANHSAFPARWVDGLCRALPGAEFLLASLAPQISDAVDPVGRSTPPRKLGRSNDGQDHTVLPYARSPAATGPCSSVHTRRKNVGETN
jgi:hypothetical protein